MTGKLAVPMLPRISDAVHVTLLVVSRGNVEPDGDLHVTGRGPSTRSVALAANVTPAPLGPVASNVNPLGTTSTGGVVSTTVTVKLAVALLVCVSELVQV